MATRSIMGLAGVGPARPEIPLVGGLTLSAARAHEICGPARRTLACMMAGPMRGPVIWIVARHERDRLNPPGVAELMEPGRLVFVTPREARDMLWTAEEALRAGVVPLVVADLRGPPALTPVRRLHLAAETGAETGAEEGRVAPVMLLLTPGDGGAPAVETRWWMAPRHRAERSAWRLERRRCRAAPPAAWDLAPDGRLTPAD